LGPLTSSVSAFSTNLTAHPGPADSNNLAGSFMVGNELCQAASDKERKPRSREYTHFMQPRTHARVSLTALLGTPVTDAQGHLRGRLKDIAVAT
jgi:hypothetical protein